MPKWILASLILCAAAGFWIWGRPRLPAVPPCRFTAFDIGQGDALLIQTPDHQDILIDGGPDDTVSQKLGKYLPAGDHELELVVLTHPHADHVNGLPAVTKSFVVRHVLFTGVGFGNAAYTEWRQLLQTQHVPESFAAAGQVYHLGQSELDVVWPARSLADTTIKKDNAAQGGGVNDSSIVLKLYCGGSRAMLMGDASADIEENILAAGVDVKADLLKVGHHGSRFSSGVPFLAAVKPRWAVISDGANNHYHHPHPSTLLRLQKIGATILRTDLRGDIQLETNGHGGWRLRT